MYILARLSLTKKRTGNIELETLGDEKAVAELICEAIVKDVQLCTAVFAAIPTALDTIGLSREKFCEIIINAKGNR